MLRHTLLLSFAFATGPLAAQQPAPAGPVLLPDSPWKARLATLCSDPPAAPDTAPTKEMLLRPELAFQKARRWLLLPTLANELGTDDEQRAAVRELLETGATELRKALAAEGADKDLGAVTALFVQQTWQFATGRELEEAHVDALHAQVVALLAVPEVAAMKDADKQRCWEFCVGMTTFFAAMLEAVEDEAGKGELRRAAATTFTTLLGAAPDRITIGARGITTKGKKRDRKATPPQPAPPVAATTGPGTAPLPASGPAIPGITWTEPPGWQKEERDGNLVFRASLCDVQSDGRPEPNDDASHQALIAFLPVQTATTGPTALFDRVWREQFAAFELGDTFVHFRGRLPSQLVVLYMGRFLVRPNTPATHGNPNTYGALWLVDLGGNRFQPIVAVVEPRDPGLGMDTFKEGAALRALSFPLGAVLDSVRPKDGKPPYPAGGYFAADDLRGNWSESSGAYGGSYYNTTTGGFAGVAVTSSGGSFALRPDGTYAYSFAYASSHPQFGNSGGSTKHDGRYRLDGDVVLVEPSRPLEYTFTCCAVGIGSRQTKAGTQRILVTVSAHRDGGFRQMPLIANGNQCDSTLAFYTEEPTPR